MKNLLRQGFAKKAIAFAFFVGLVSPSALAYQAGVPTSGAPSLTESTSLVAAVAPSISNLNVTTATGTASVGFTLNTTATTTLWIKDTNNTIVRTLIFDNNLSAGAAGPYTWDGKDNNGAAVASGSYVAQVVAYNAASSDIKSFNFTFTSNGGGGGVIAPIVSVSVNPTSFDPTLGQTTNVTYTLSQPASLSVLVKLNGSIIRTLRSQSLQNPGTYTLNWNGYSDTNPAVQMAPNNYVVEVYADNTAGSDTKTATATIVNGGGQTTAPVLSNVYATPTPFNPNNTSTNIYFTVDKASTATVSIMNGSATVKVLTSSTSVSAGTHNYSWDGRDSSGNVVANGTYTAKVVVTNSAGSDTQTATVQVDTNGGSGSCDSVVTSSYANPSSFNPTTGADTQIYYTLSRSAYVEVTIKENNSVTKYLVTGENESSGSHSVYWNGRNTSGSYASNGAYTYEVRATASGCNVDVDSQTIFVVGSDDGGYTSDWPSTNENLITNLTVDPSVIRPLNGERTTIRFTLSNAAKLRVEILDGTRLVRSLRNTGSSKQSSGTYSYTWDGRDTNGQVVNKVYQVRVMADDGNYSDTDRATVQVTSGDIATGDRCAGFSDVSVSSPFCKAIELMSKKHIFDGYSDGTFRPYEPINRAETAKVVVLALGYNIETAGFGRLYPDTVSGSWYMPYLQVAQKYNIATGYPDGTFRPANTINRVELLRVFLEANHLSLSTCSSQPYDDTPITSDTNWYMKYACYAKNNGLMGGQYSTKLYPAEPMTRGDVAQLFYDFEVKGLYGNYNGAHVYDYEFLNQEGVCNSYDVNGNCSNSNLHTCLSYDNNGYCTQYSNSNSNNSTSYCTSYSSNGTCLNYSYNNNVTSNNSSYCTSYSSNGTCLNYSYNNTTNNNNSCYSYDSNGNCLSYNNNSNNSNGYYVYQNGQYVWVSY